MFFTRLVRAEHFVTATGRLRYYFDKRLPAEHKPTMAPHGSGRVNVARTLERTFGCGTYPQHAHQPRIVDKGDMARLVASYPEEFARTRAARFRAHDTILPHMLLAAYLVQEGTADYNGFRRTRHLMRMVRLFNSASLNRRRLFTAWVRRPRFLPVIDEKAESVARRFLHFLFPKPSAFEI
jgi:hypothetical protein